MTISPTGCMRSWPATSAATCAAVGAVAMSLAGCSGPGAVQVTAPQPTGTASQQCAALLEALPDTVAGDERSRDVEPADAAAAAWGDPPVVLRCGVPKPKALVPTSGCFQVNGVGWLATQNGREVSGDQPVNGPLTFTTIGRPTYVEVVVPHVEGRQAADPLPALASSIKKTIPLRHPCQ